MGRRRRGRGSLSGDRSPRRHRLHVAPRAELRPLRSRRPAGAHLPAMSAPITILREAATTAPSASEDDPLWYKDAIIYQAHVKSFFDKNNDGVGDFQGLTQKLDYLQSLGITCLWLLPFFPSPLKDDGYDIADYRSIHPSYGTLEDFKAFVEAAHDRRI